MTFKAHKKEHSSVADENRGLLPRPLPLSYILYPIVYPIFVYLDHAESLAALADGQKQRLFELLVALVVRQTQLVEAVIEKVSFRLVRVKIKNK